MSGPAAIEQWRPLATKYAASPLVADEILAIIWSESSGKPTAQNPADPSWGLMQVTLPIARHYGSVDTPEMLLDPEINIRIGSAFLGDLKRKYAERFPDGEWVAAYNEGEGNLLRGRQDPAYVAAFKAHLEVLGATSV